MSDEKTDEELAAEWAAEMEADELPTGKVTLTMVAVMTLPLNGKHRSPTRKKKLRPI